MGMVISHLFVQYKENTSFKVSENLCLTLYYHEDVLNFWKIVIRMNGRNGMKTIAGKLVAIVQKQVMRQSTHTLIVGLGFEILKLKVILSKNLPFITIIYHAKFQFSKTYRSMKKCDFLKYLK